MDGHTAKIDDALNVLKSPNRRRILAYLHGEAVESVTVTELASHLASSESRNEQTLAARLHHVHLPKLEDYGILEYDARSNAIRYRANARVEKMLTCLRKEY